MEEHGPLVAEDPLLVGELENFPHEAQLKIQQAGGFESFLLESLRFIKMGRCIGLAKHAVTLQQAGHGPSLDDLDILDPDTNSPDLHDPGFTNYVDNFSSAPTDVYPILPNPYLFGFQPASGDMASLGSMTVNDPPYVWSNGDDQDQFPYFFPNGYGELDRVCEFDDGDFEPDLYSGEGLPSLTTEENILKKHAAVQVRANISLFEYMRWST